jgi:hypothetical protein
MFSWSAEYPPSVVAQPYTSESVETSSEDTILSDDGAESPEVADTVNESSQQPSDELIPASGLDSTPDTEPEVQPEQTPESAPELVPADDSAPVSDLTPTSETTEPTSWLWNLIGTVVFAQEVPEAPADVSTPQDEPRTLENSDTALSSESESVSEATGTTSSDTAVPYDIVEVLYTLDGAQWTSLGFLAAHEFPGASFVIPIEDASAWEDISNIQVAIQSVPTTDAISPDIYLDALWIDVGYENTNTDNLAASIVSTQQHAGESVPVPTSSGQGEESSLQNTSSSVLSAENIPEELDTDEESNENVDEVSDEEPAEGEVVNEAGDAPIIGAPASSVQSSYTTLLHAALDNTATHSCEASPFSISVPRGSFITSTITLQTDNDGASYSLVIGKVPRGLDVHWARTGKRYRPLAPDDTYATLMVRSETWSRRGDFTVPIVLTKETDTTSSVVCQVNIKNE